MREEPAPPRRPKPPGRTRRKAAGRKAGPARSRPQPIHSANAGQAKRACRNVSKLGPRIPSNQEPLPLLVVPLAEPPPMLSAILRPVFCCSGCPTHAWPSAWTATWFDRHGTVTARGCGFGCAGPLPLAALQASQQDGFRQTVRFERGCLHVIVDCADLRLKGASADADITGLRLLDPAHGLVRQDYRLSDPSPPSENNAGPFASVGA